MGPLSWYINVEDFCKESLRRGEADLLKCYIYYLRDYEVYKAAAVFKLSGFSVTRQQYRTVHTLK